MVRKEYPCRRPSKKKEIKLYCESLIGVTFEGETSNNVGSEVTDTCNTRLRYHLGVYLKLADECIRNHNTPNRYPYYHFTGEEDDFVLLLKMIAIERKAEHESNAECYARLSRDKRRFMKFFHQRKDFESQRLHTTEYWGTRQQLRAGKVISDWIDRRSNGRIDPIFGVLLCPTAGRTGPGDSYWFHTTFFDQSGPFAYHSAVHDAFGYLRNNHNKGPGYNYLSTCSLFQTESPFAGHLSGIRFWKKILLTENMVSS